MSYQEYSYESADNTNLRKYFFKSNKCLRVKENIFQLKKLKRNGLLEKKIIKKTGIINTGRWTHEEHVRFMESCFKHGAKWNKVRNLINFRFKMMSGQEQLHKCVHMHRNM